MRSRRLMFLLACAMLAVSTAARAQSGCPATVWDLAADWSVALNGPAPEVPDSCGNLVWRFVGSTSRSVDPANFYPLGTFVHTPWACDPSGANFQGWQRGASSSPTVLLNATGVDQHCDSWAWIWVPNGAVDAHPGPNEAGGIEWKSPFSGIVHVDVTFTDIDPWGGDGITWVVERNALVQGQGAIANGGTGSFSQDIDILAGDSLYILIGPGGGYYYDSTTIALRITAVSGIVSAEAGGPYFTGPGAEGYTVLLDGTASTNSDQAQPLAYGWDLDNDGLYDDADTPTVVVVPPDTIGASVPVGLRVVGVDNVESFDTAEVRVFGAPSAAITSPADGFTCYYSDDVTFAGSTAENIVEYTWLANGQLLSHERTFTTATLPPGQSPHTITYQVRDNVGRTAEAQISVRVRSQEERTDLVIEWGDISFWQEGQTVINPGPGDPIQIRAVVHNYGGTESQPGTVSFHDNYYDAQNQPHRVQIGSPTAFAAVPVRGTSTAEIAWSASLPEGYHVIETVVGQDPLETHLDNNTATHFIVVGDHQAAGTMSVQVGISSNPGWAYVGRPFTIAGVASYRWGNSFTLPLLGGKVSMKFLGGQEWSSLTGQSGAFSQGLTAPLTPGSYTLRVTVTDDTISGFVDLPFTVSVEQGPDLTVNGIWLGSAVATLPETVYANIVNRGDVAVTGSFLNRIEIRLPSGVDGPSFDVPFSGTIAAHSSATIQLQGWTPPVPGAYAITVRADASGDIAEADETNNSQTASPYVYPYLVDLEIVGLRRVCDTLYATVRNRGGLPCGGGTVTFSDSSQSFSATVPPIGGKDAAVEVHTTAGFAGGATVVTATVASPEDANPANDSMAATFDFSPRTDFVLGDVWIGNLRYTGTNIVYLTVGNAVNVEIANAGCTAASGTLRLMVEGTVKETAPIALDGGQVRVVSFTRTFDEYWAGTSYHIAADVSVQAPETDAAPANNVRTEPLWIYPALPDYEVLAGNISFSCAWPHPRRGDLFRISALVCNRGQQPGNAFQVAFYEEGVEQIGVTQSLTSDPLEAGACRSYSPVDALGLPVDWGTGFSGNHTILVQVAPIAGTQDDPNDGNNQATRKVWVNTPPVAHAALASRSTTVKPGDTLTFSAAGSNDYGDLDGLGAVMRYEWEFSENPGVWVPTTANSISHRYGGSGDYAVALRVVDNSDEASEVVTLPASVEIRYDVTASAGSGGSIAPAGTLSLLEGESQGFTVTPDAHYHVVDVVLDAGTAAETHLGAVTSFSVGPVTAHRTVAVLFAVDSFTITASAGAGGRIEPAGAVSVSYGGGATFTATADPGFHLEALLVNGTPVLPPVSSYSFSGVQADQTVEAVFNADPQAVDQAVTTVEDAALALTLTASDPEGDALQYTVVAGPAHGTLSGVAPHLVYTPAADFFGSDSFTFKVSEGTVDSNVATVAITVAAVNDAPSFAKGADQSVLSGAGAQSVAAWATQISAGPANESGQTLSFTVTNDNNTLFSAQPVVAANGTLSYTPASNAGGSTTVTVTLRDGGGTADGGADASVAQTFTITVAPNLALNQTATASTKRGTSYVAGKAVDGSTATSWMSSKTTGSQWVSVDLGSTRNVSRVVIRWPATYYARGFKVETSTNGAQWTQRYATTSGDGSLTDIGFGTPGVRYVRVSCTTPNNSSYYGVAELEAYE